MAKVVKSQSVDNILDLPVELLELIMSYISYDEIAKIRLVCHQFNICSQRLLNRGFVKVEKYHALCFKKVKAQLPRRESERRNHPLARHCDVLSAIETRLSLLGMTYMKYVEMNLCCFIPGKVIDEIYRVLRFIQGNPNPPRVHELLQELRDISSMAMEYFEEKIAPSLKSRLSASSSVISVPMGSTSMNRSMPSSANTSPLPYQLQKINTYPETDNKTNGVFKQIQTSQNTIKKELTEMKVKFKDYSQVKRDIVQIKSKLKDSEKSSLEKDQTIAELKSELEDLKRRMNEVDKKNGLKYEEQDSKESKTSKRKSPKSPKNRKKARTSVSRTSNVKMPSPVKEMAKPVTGVRRSNRKSSANTTASTTSTTKDVKSETVSTATKRKQNVESNASKRGKRVKT